MTIQDVLVSKDYEDIMYMCKHIKDVSARISVIEQLGYRTIVQVLKVDSNIGRITQNANGVIKVQITRKIKNTKLAYYAVIDDNRTKQYNNGKRLFARINKNTK